LKIRLAQVGCGGMGLRHIYGLRELREKGFDTFELVALCDVHRSAAEYVAGEAEKGVGRKLRVYTDYDQMLSQEKSLDAVNIVTDTRFHHTLALKAFDAGKHVAAEKPMGLTVGACRRMIEGAKRAGKVLSVSENYRRDPINRLVRAILEAEAIGEPRLVLDISASGTRMLQQVAAWRHMKLRGGYVVEYGVHNADLLLYLMGDVERVYAETHLWEEVRYSTNQPLAGQLARFYGHRVKEDEEKAEAVECTAEDMALAVLRFKSGAMGQLSMSIASPGEGVHAGVIYGSEGSLKLPGSRTGRPVQLTRIDAREPLSESEALALVPRFRLDDATAAFFQSRRRLSSYDMPFEQIDRILIAIELQDFANAILNGQQPEVTGEEGLKAVALSYAILESGYLRRPVSFVDVVEDRVNAYQREINESVGL
jgi:predicted dehydrogenase